MQVNVKQIIVLILVFLQGIGSMPAQNDTANRAIGEVAVVAGSTKYQYGAHVEQFDSLQLDKRNHSSLANLMQSIAGVYVKQDAAGLATIKIRGTDANHTAVLIDGVNINSLTLGHSNLSAVPLWLFDEVRVQYGGSSAMLGTDAIGGAVQLNTKPSWNKGFRSQTKLERGSLSQTFIGEKLIWSDSVHANDFRVYYTSSKNNFTFSNPFAINYLTKQVPIDTQRNAAYQNFGLSECKSWKLSKRSELDIKGMFTNSSHQIQPEMSTNYYGGTFDSISDKYYLILSNFRYKAPIFALNLSLGDAYSSELYYSGAKPSKIATNQLIGVINGEATISESSSLRFGCNTNYIKPEVYAYKDNKAETRVDPFLSYFQRIGQKLRLSANMRSSLVSGYAIPFAPSLGAEVLEMRNAQSRLTGRASFSCGYKIPTFNMRFWDKVGNPDLKAENSYGIDLGQSYQFCSVRNQLQTSLTAYIIRINNLIRWVQMDVWRPENVQQVESYGLEYSCSAEQSLGRCKLREGIQYAYNTTIVIRNSAQSDLNGHLLSYSPQHLASCYGSISAYRLSIWFDASYVDLRYSTDRKQLPSYYICNTKIDYTIPIKQQQVMMYVGVDNLFNAEYQNQLAYAMPGRLYRAGLQYSF